MCFSAEVSYGSAALLVTTGAVATIGNNKSSQRMIAAIPFLFGLQQAAEGIVWQTMGPDPSESLRRVGVVIFLTFAYLIWPSWIPWSFYFIETGERRRKILMAIGGLGLVVSALVASILYGLKVDVYVSGHSLAYVFPDYNRHWPANLEALLYFTPTVIPFFISSSRTIKQAGLLIFAAMLLAKYINRETEASVWCFFAAVISFYIAVNVLWLKKGELR
ncbi:MAG: hypothetical protein JSU04_09930 [Bdellovibrionales bacterium]|nr:hypothetical protein [Bdellovibrionales bacterium]